MSYTWEALSSPRWSEDFARIVGGWPEGVFPRAGWTDADVVPGAWWAVRRDGGDVVALAVLDTVWGDGEVMVAVDPACVRSGAGRFAMEQLQREAHARGLAYLRNQVPSAHPQPEAVVAWLESCGFEAGSSEGEYVCRVRAVRSAA
jgi:ribosomal protein S18 acetylase RimI-like enzyme